MSTRVCLPHLPGHARAGAPAPQRLIEGDLLTGGLTAHVIVGKHADHLPLYRHAQIYARQGIERVCKAALRHELI